MQSAVDGQAQNEHLPVSRNPMALSGCDDCSKPLLSIRVPVLDYGKSSIELSHIFPDGQLSFSEGERKADMGQVGRYGCLTVGHTEARLGFSFTICTTFSLGSSVSYITYLPVMTAHRLTAWQLESLVNLEPQGFCLAPHLTSGGASR